MKPALYIVEDDKVVQFYPLSLSRPIFELQCGLLTLKNRIINQFKTEEVTLIFREWLTEVFKSQNPTANVNRVSAGDAILINGRLLIDDEIHKSIVELKINEKLISKSGQIIAVHIQLSEADKPSDIINNNSSRELKEIPCDYDLLNYSWELIFKNEEIIAQDSTNLFKLGQTKGNIDPGANLINKKNIYISDSAKIKAGVVIDAESGPIIIDDNATVMANASISGPVYIGKNTTIKMGAKIYEGTYIGEWCKVGGEVEVTIIHSYSNKQHEGFLGHSYLGSWCNIGADSNNSDLKNNYGTVDVILNGEKINTGLMFVGLIMGDHSKSGINTMFNTGTIIGFSCNVFGSGYLPKSIPSLTWLDSATQPVEYKLAKAIEVAERVMARRKVDFSEADRKLFQKIFEITSNERDY